MTLFECPVHASPLVIPARGALNWGGNKSAGIRVKDSAVCALLAHTVGGGSTWIPAREVRGAADAGRAGMTGGGRIGVILGMLLAAAFGGGRRIIGDTIPIMQNCRIIGSCPHNPYVFTGCGMSAY